MENVIVGVLVVAALAVAAYLNREKIKEIIDKRMGGEVASPPGPTITVPGVPTPAAPLHDYAKWGHKTPYELQMMAGQKEGPFPNGVPPTWSWKEWARVNGKTDPTLSPVESGPAIDRSGFVLEANGMRRRNTHFAGVAQPYQFVATGHDELAWSSQGNGGFVETWILNDAGIEVPGTRSTVINGNSAGQTYLSGASGPHTYFLKADLGFVFEVEHKAF